MSWTNGKGVFKLGIPLMGLLGVACETSIALGE